jgi:hypothetical protein
LKLLHCVFYFLWNFHHISHITSHTLLCFIQKQQDWSNEKTELNSVPDLELVGNPSSFAVYSSVRQAVLTCFMQRLSTSLQQAIDGIGDSDSEDDADQKATSDLLKRVPKVIQSIR